MVKSSKFVGRVIEFRGFARSVRERKISKNMTKMEGKSIPKSIRCLILCLLGFPVKDDDISEPGPPEGPPGVPRGGPPGVGPRGGGLRERRGAP